MLPGSFPKTKRDKRKNMQGDIRPSGGVYAGSRRPAIVIGDRPRLKAERRPAIAHVDIVVAQHTKLAPVIRPKAPQANAYHVVRRTTDGEAPQHLRVEGLEATRKWLRKMRRRSLVKRVRHSLKGAGLVYALSSVVFIAGMAVIAQGVFLNNQVKEQAQVLSAATDDSLVSESTDSDGKVAIPSEEKPKPKAVDSYKVAADMPRTITISSIGVKARVLQAGVDANNQLQTPKSIYDTAWYSGSSKPGEIGAAVIDGHYVGPTTSGVFSHLGQLKKDDKIVIERGDGKQLTFRVVAVETVPASAVDMLKVLTSVDTAKPGLNLITCGGKYNAKKFEFGDRTVVYSVLEQ